MFWSRAPPPNGDNDDFALLRAASANGQTRPSVSCQRLILTANTELTQTPASDRRLFSFGPNAIAKFESGFRRGIGLFHSTRTARFRSFRLRLPPDAPRLLVYSKFLFRLIFLPPLNVVGAPGGVASDSGFNSIARTYSEIDFSPSFCTTPESAKLRHFSDRSVKLLIDFSGSDCRMRLRLRASVRLPFRRLIA